MAAPFYEQIDHTADLGILVRGADVRELFENAARALVDLHTDLGAVLSRDTRRVEARGLDWADLLRHWLGELHFLYETERLLLSDVAIVELDETHIVADCRGEVFDPERHETRGEIKAVTHHGLEIWEEIDEDDGSTRLEAQVIFDL